MPHARLPHEIVRLNDRLAKSFVSVSCVLYTKHKNFRHGRHFVVVVVVVDTAVPSRIVQFDLRVVVTKLRLPPSFWLSKKN